MFAKPHPALVSRITAHPTLRRASSPSFAGMRPSNSFALTLLSDPHPLTPITSILYKNIGGEGASTSQSPSPIACPLAQFPLNSHGIMSFADPHPLTRLESYRFKNIGGRVLRTSDLPKSFVCNIYGPSRKCCKHRAYKDVKSVRCNTYKKLGVGVLWLTSHPTKGVFPERPSGAEGSPSTPRKTPAFQDLRFAEPPSESCRKGSLTSQQLPSRPHICRRRRSKRASDCLVAPSPQQIQRSALGQPSPILFPGRRWAHRIAR